jgi:hypothetical protein
MKTYCSDTHEIGVLNEGFELVRVSLWMAEGDATCPTVPLSLARLGIAFAIDLRKLTHFPRYGSLEAGLRLDSHMVPPPQVPRYPKTRCHSFRSSSRDRYSASTGHTRCNMNLPLHRLLGRFNVLLR